MRDDLDVLEAAADGIGYWNAAGVVCHSCRRAGADSALLRHRETSWSSDPLVRYSEHIDSGIPPFFAAHSLASALTQVEATPESLAGQWPARAQEHGIESEPFRWRDLVAGPQPSRFLRSAQPAKYEEVHGQGWTFSGVVALRTYRGDGDWGIEPVIMAVDVEGSLRVPKDERLVWCGTQGHDGSAVLTLAVAMAKRMNQRL